MTIFYTWDRKGFKSDSIECNDENKPPRSTTEEPPIPGVGEVVKRVGNAWMATTETPNYDSFVDEAIIEKLVYAKDIMQAMPRGVKRELDTLMKNAILPAENELYDTADLLLSILTSGAKVNVNSPRFDALAAWMVTNTSCTDDHVTKVKALPEAR